MKILPNESGGVAGTQKELFAEEMKKLEQHREWFLQDEQTQRVDESKRPGKAKSATDLFGVEGSFKKLEIDWILRSFGYDQDNLDALFHVLNSKRNKMIIILFFTSVL